MKGNTDDTCTCAGELRQGIRRDISVPMDNCLTLPTSPVRVFCKRKNGKEAR